MNIPSNMLSGWLLILVSLLGLFLYVRRLTIISHAQCVAPELLVKSGLRISETC